MRIGPFSPISSRALSALTPMYPPFLIVMLTLSRASRLQWGTSTPSSSACLIATLFGVTVVLTVV